MLRVPREFLDMVLDLVRAALARIADSREVFVDRCRIFRALAREVIGPIGLANAPTGGGRRLGLNHGRESPVFVWFAPCSFTDRQRLTVENGIGNEMQQSPQRFDFDLCCCLTRPPVVFRHEGLNSAVDVGAGVEGIGSGDSLFA